MDNCCQFPCGIPQALRGCESKTRDCDSTSAASPLTVTSEMEAEGVRAGVRGRGVHKAKRRDRRKWGVCAAATSARAVMSG